MSTATGSVKFYSLEKGYGFITLDNDGGDIFFSYRDLPKTAVKRDGGKLDVNKGQRVECMPVSRSRGPVASNIRYL